MELEIICEVIDGLNHCKVFQPPFAVALHSLTTVVYSAMMILLIWDKIMDGDQ